MYENSTSAITVAEKTADIIATTPLVLEVIILWGNPRRNGGSTVSRKK